MQKAYQIPIAHGEGRYYAPQHLLTEIKANDQILFRYCNETGVITDQANPNGSVENIAGICNMTRNVFGMMPHPERACHPMLGNTDGYELLASVIEKALI
jgi:phosphoribosylformylglycinamidine synthase